MLDVELYSQWLINQIEQVNNTHKLCYDFIILYKCVIIHVNDWKATGDPHLIWYIFEQHSTFYWFFDFDVNIFLNGILFQYKDGQKQSQRC